MKTKGSALISALFIMTLVAIAATAMSMRLQLDIYRTQLIINQDKLYLASQAVTFWATDQLKQANLLLTTTDPSAIVLKFPNRLQTLYPNVKLDGNIVDLQARFNLNNISDKKFQPFFYGLLENQTSNLSAFERRTLIEATRQWISPYQVSQAKNEFMQFYTKQKPSYWPAFQLMQHVSEFRLVANVTPALYRALEPHITALPEITPININTASKVLLKSLGNGLNASQIEELWTARGTDGISNLNDIRPLLQKLQIPQEQITLESHYFLCTSSALSDDQQLTRYTVLKRTKNKKGKISIQTVYESINTP